MAVDFSAEAPAGASGGFEQEAVSNVTPPMGSDFRNALRRKCRSFPARYLGVFDNIHSEPGCQIIAEPLIAASGRRQRLTLFAISTASIGVTRQVRRKTGSRDRRIEGRRFVLLYWC